MEGNGSAGDERVHLLTISVEDFFHSTAVNRLIPRRQWKRFESRVERCTDRTLALLDGHGIHATFFVLGWVADEMPEIVRQIVDQGHEVACKGYHHLGLDQLGPEAFREEVLRGREAIEKAAGRPVLGHRIAQGRITQNDLWALSILAEEGFCYDSSVAPQFRSIVKQPWRRLPHVHETGYENGHGRGLASIIELPISAWGPNVLPIPLAGGNYYRQLPVGLARRAFEHWNRKFDAPFNMYFHIWELDPDLPKLTQAGWFTRLRQYRNLGKIESVLRGFFEHHRFQSIAGYLDESGFGREVVQAQHQRRESIEARRPEPVAVESARGSAEVLTQQPVTIVIPCHNEEVVLPYLANTLQEVCGNLAERYEFSLVLVDDASTDRTWESFERVFGGWPDVTFFRHDTNQGVCAAIMTGLRNARTEIVCSMDCDCTYDPSQLERMIPLLAEDVDVVTASPYHPEGMVHGVPRSRLMLSRYLSRAYQVVFHQRLWTYTSCFRVYRRSSVAEMRVEHPGYLGMAEMLARLDFAGRRIAECPALLEVRLLGASKMKIVGTILSHARLLARLAWLRLRAARSPDRRPRFSTEPTRAHSRR